MERATRQNAAIRQALASAGRPLSPAEVLAAAREQAKEARLQILDVMLAAIPEPRTGAKPPGAKENQSSRLRRAA